MGNQGYLSKEEYQKRLNELNIERERANKELNNAKNEEERKDAELKCQLAVNAISYFTTHFKKQESLDSIQNKPEEELPEEIAEEFDFTEEELKQIEEEMMLEAQEAEMSQDRGLVR